MDSSLDQGLPFELYDLWQQSIFSHKASRLDRDLFEDIQLDIPDLPSLQVNNETAPDAKPLILPTLQLLEGAEWDKPTAPEPPSSSIHETRNAQFAEPSGTQTLDPWNLEDVIRGENELPRLKTWEAFQKIGLAEADAACRLSELGPSAISTAFARRDGRGKTADVLPQRSIIQPLYSLALGRSSVFFTWNEEKSRFHPVLPDVPIHGLSREATKSFIEGVLQFGSLLRTLRNRSMSYNSRWKVAACPSQVALMSCIATALDSTEYYISSQFLQVRSLLQFQHLLDHPQRFLELLQSLAEQCEHVQSNETVISTARRIAQVHLQQGSKFDLVAHAVLAGVSMPWLEDTLREMGLMTEDVANTHLKATHPETVPNDDSFSHIMDERVEDSMFGDLGILRLIKETKDAARLLRIHAPQDAVIQCTDSVFTNWNTPSRADPLELIQPLIATQWRVTNHVLLRQLFDENLLHQHLNLQRAFHLFGNGNFVKRLTTALFSQETQTAERKRGNLPTSEAMGLRLGTKQGQRWPPASSELRLTLMGILSEAYFGSENRDSEAGQQTKELPGSLNFSIRELPEADIDKVMDAGSIYALDFLRLQYMAPPLLDAILTPATMRAYDGIFKFMLRLLRMNDVTTNLRMQTKSLQRQGRDAAAGVSFSIQARHIVTTLTTYFVEMGIATPWSRLMASIDGVKSSLARVVETGEFQPGHQQIGIADLRRWHESCLKTIRARLFIRRKYENLRFALEEVFTEILKGASLVCLTEKETRARGFKNFHNAVDKFLQQLQILIGRARKVTDTHDTTGGEREDELVKMLLCQLDWNGYYGKADDEMSVVL
ncbi:hypothetical protein K431DRAFT_221004 [Polychaeton citri CBS 116435]|uniref:Spindle pole body component n=1 Tax=Polychaeton citri CBS 116435 TaxID=1314669 RepID=A0A9P4QDY0_9PEZI|nr:hypothetical protein K431DRAFT_221004 [Polychaeton citri CBS 116435]